MMVIGKKRRDGCERVYANVTVQGSADHNGMQASKHRVHRAPFLGPSSYDRITFIVVRSFHPPTNGTGFELLMSLKIRILARKNAYFYVIDPNRINQFLTLW